MVNYPLAASQQQEDFKEIFSQLEYEVRTHQLVFPDQEVCGLIYKSSIVSDGVLYLPVSNIHSDPNNNFLIDHNQYEEIKKEWGTPIAISHTHPKQDYAAPSDKDVASCTVLGIPFVVWGRKDFTIVNPKPYDSSVYEGRHFVHGVIDCYTIIRDWYKNELKINLPNFVRHDGWWDKGGNMYIDHFEECGFRRIDLSKAKKHDLILMSIRAPVPNHGAIYLGDMKILHHLPTRLSKVDIYGGYWQRNTSMVIRHKCLEE